EPEDAPRPGAVAVLDRSESLHKGDAAADQQKSHDGGERYAKKGGRNRPAGIGETERRVPANQPAERHGVARQENPHAELAPTFRCQWGFGRLDTNHMI